MNAVKAAFQALSPEQQQLVETKKVEGRRPADEWLGLFGQVAAYDELADNARRGGHGFFARRFASKHNVPDGLRQFALPFLAILREDQDPEKPVDLWLDLSGPQMYSKQVNETPPYKHPPYHKVVDSFFADPWFQGHAHFVDGAHVNFVITDHVRSTKKTKRNPRGKIKTKVKAKKKTEVSVTLSVPNRNYARAEPTAPRRGVPKEKLKPGESRTTVKTSGTIEARNADVVPGIDLLLELISAAYERVEPARKKKL
jgi:hypothetical protein